MTRKARYARTALKAASVLALSTVGLLATLPVADAQQRCEQASTGNR